MSEHKSPITDFVATDDSGGFFNLRTGEVLSVDEMLCLYTRSEFESVPIGYRRQRSAFIALNLSHSRVRGPQRPWRARRDTLRSAAVAAARVHAMLNVGAWEGRTLRARDPGLVRAVAW